MKTTLICLYDSQQILNLVGAYHIQADETVFLYEESLKSMIHNETLEKYCKKNISYQKYDNENLEKIIEELMKKHENITIDIHGGSDYAISYLSKLTTDHDNITLVYPDVERKQLLYVHPKRDSEELNIPHLSVQEMVALYGGAVRNLPEARYDEEGKQIVYYCLEEKRKNKKRWHQFANIMSKASYRNKNNREWNLDAKLANAYKDYLEELEALNCINDVYEKQSKRFFRLTNKDYAQLLIDVGVPLEYDVYYQLVESEFFDDVDIRVNIDWNGGIFEGYDPESELDVVATKDARMFSISCKSGDFDSMDLYEVKVNANKFGGIRCIPILCDDEISATPGLDEKARELEVVVIKGQDIRAKQIVDVIQANL